MTQRYQTRKEVATRSGRPGFKAWVWTALLAFALGGCQQGTSVRVYADVSKEGSTKPSSANEESAKRTVEGVAADHIEANVPSEGEFDKLLRRDIQSHLKMAGIKGEIAKLELLRKGPTQSGVAYPKYYVWIELTPSKISGAVRLAAIEKTRFQVSHFVRSEEIAAGKVDIRTIFPPAVADRIDAIVKAQEK